MLTRQKARIQEESLRNFLEMKMSPTQDRKGALGEPDGEAHTAGEGTGS